jgi:hypothetical protein
MAAVKLAMSGSLAKEVSPISRLCSTEAFARSGSRAIVAFRQRSHNLGLVRREKSHERFGTPWSLDQELIANRLYSKTRIMSAAKKRHSVHASSSSAASSACPRLPARTARCGSPSTPQPTTSGGSPLPGGHRIPDP